MSVLPGIYYGLLSNASLHWAGWNDEYVVFDEASGQTHQLDAVRAYVLHLLGDGPQSVAEVSLALRALPAFPADSAANEILGSIFSEFETSGVVKRIGQGE